jgi:hypothetical protein
MAPQKYDNWHFISNFSIFSLNSSSDLCNFRKFKALKIIFIA